MRWLAVATLCCSTIAAAHDADVIYARLERLDGASMIEIVTLTNATLGQLAPIDADGDGMLSQADLDARAEALKAGVWDDMPLSSGGHPCLRRDESARLEEGFVTLAATWRCEEGTLRQDFKLLRILPTNYRVVLGSQSMGERGRQFAQGVFTALELPRPSAPGVVDVARLSEGFRRGLGDALSLEVIAGLCLVALSTRRSRRLFLNGAGAIIGAAASCWVRLGAPSATVLIVLGGLALVLVRDDARPWLGPVGGVVVGAGLGLRAGSWAFADGAGWVGAAALSAAIVIGIGWPLGGLLVRRPGLLTAIRWVSLAAVCFVSGIQLAR